MGLTCGRCSRASVRGCGGHRCTRGTRWRRGGAGPGRLVGPLGRSTRTAGAPRAALAQLAARREGEESKRRALAALGRRRALSLLGSWVALWDRACRARVAASEG